MKSHATVFLRRTCPLFELELQERTSAQKLHTIWKILKQGEKNLNQLELKDANIAKEEQMTKTSFTINFRKWNRRKRT